MGGQGFGGGIGFANNPKVSLQESDSAGTGRDNQRLPDLYGNYQST